MTEENVTASIAAFLRIAYRELSSIVLLNVAFVLASLPLVTVGAAVIALCETVTRMLTDRPPRRATTERDRLRLFASSFREHVVAGVPYSACVIWVAISMISYVRLAAARSDGLFFVGALFGLYVFVILIVWLFRAASVVVRHPERSPGFRTAVFEGGHLALSAPYYSALQILSVGGLIVVTGIAGGIGIALLFPCLTAVVEVIAYEELTEGGADDLVNRYQSSVIDA